MTVSDEDRIETIRTFSDQAMSAVLDGNELLFFQAIENFFQKRGKANFQTGWDAGYEAGWADAWRTAQRIVEGSGNG